MRNWRLNTPAGTGGKKEKTGPARMCAGPVTIACFTPVKVQFFSSLSLYFLFIFNRNAPGTNLFTCCFHVVCALR
ncbi:MAG: hypothetical protein DYG98_06220 [Haliscomenobacteraceae bacterium CHB4]|nr:hypothetical protein [Haliscomenobacteraceae bacterium CHB4]